MSPTIRIDEDVFRVLQEKATPFIDTPNDVLRRVLGLGAAQSRQRAVEAESPKRSTRGRGRDGRARAARGKIRAMARPRAPAGSLLAINRYETPLLQSVEELGGSAAAAHVMKALERKLGADLTVLDRDTLPSGAVRWKSRAQFVRLNLVKQGLLAKDADRGIWTITERGRSRLREQERRGVALQKRGNDARE